jgi:hypothetical protein
VSQCVNSFADRTVIHNYTPLGLRPASRFFGCSPSRKTRLAKAASLKAQTLSLLTSCVRYVRLKLESCIDCLLPFKEEITRLTTRANKNLYLRHGRSHLPRRTAYG